MWRSNFVLSINHQECLWLFRRYLPLKPTRIARLSSLQVKTLNLKSSLNVPYSAGKCFRYRCSAIQGLFVAKNDHKQDKTYFQELNNFRKEQAQRSILLLVPSKEDIPFALAKCEQFGIVSNAFSYTDEADNHLVLIEFSDEAAIQDFFKNCQYQHTNDSFPLFSRIIQFERNSKSSLPKVKVKLQEDVKTESFLKIASNVSEVIKNIYLNEKLTELDTRLRYFLCTLIKDSVSSVFPHCDIFPFGSSTNGIGRRGCDLDVMIKLYSDHDHRASLHKENIDEELIFFNKTCIGQKSKQQKVVNFLGSYFHSFLPGVTSVQKVLHARVPIMKLNHKILKMDCDISVNNMSAIFMSDIVYFFGEVDARFRPVLYAVKKWAKEAGITHATPGSWITNFGLTTLLIFFFQKEQLLPSLNDALVIVDEENSPNFHLQYLKSIDEWKNHALQNKKSLAEILVDFLTFLAEYQFDKNVVSLMSGKGRPHSQVAITLWVPYPFDEDTNITKNVSEYEFSELRHKASTAAKSLKKQLHQKINSVEFSTLLGVSKIVKKPRKGLDDDAYYELNNSKHKIAKLKRM